MAFGITLNKDGRQRLAGVLRGLLIAQLVVSLVMAIFCYNTTVHVLALLQQIHKLSVYVLYGLIFLQAYSIKLHYTSGFRLLTWLLRYQYWSRAATVTRVWLVTGTLIAVNGLLVHAACKNIIKALMQDLSHSLHVGISMYLTEPSWKMLIDTMQVSLGCCGADHPGDWHEIPWLNVDFFNEDSELVMKLVGPDGNLQPPVTPYSCCTPNVLTACYHDPFQQYQESREWSEPLSAASLSATGCTRAVSVPLTRAALVIHLLSWLMLILQAVIVALTMVLRDAAAQVIETSQHTVHDYRQLSAYRSAVARRRSMRRVRSRGYACLS